ncbi:YajQ family cyclic di-GMP-binding protein [Enterococcus hirae]|nr:YajQ family cyclic di-GMP-binding protein [Enterococcaceae bacterium]MCI1919562.1 YajQ family cyclic di-GMP-binding protein [Enterococcaceae bacterium]MDM8213433.1 YajQ family cyclic di-GMP-binding protein [Enterococcus hirae]
MAAKESSFDIASDVNLEEVKNGIQIALKELKNRFDFKDSIVEIKLEDTRIVIVSDDDYKIEQIKDVLLSRLIKRQVPIKNIHWSASEHALGGNARQNGDLVNGLDKETAKKITASIKDLGLKVKTQIQDDRVRVSGKNRDDLQKVIQKLKEQDFPVDLQFVNYR